MFVDIYIHVHILKRKQVEFPSAPECARAQDAICITYTSCLLCMYLYTCISICIYVYLHILHWRALCRRARDAICITYTVCVLCKYTHLHMYICISIIHL